MPLIRRRRLRRFLERIEVRVGIEEELFLISRRGSLVRAADDVIMEAAELLKSDHSLLDTCWEYVLGLDPEPNPAQIEYITQPVPPEKALEACKVGRELIRKAASRMRLLVLLESMHPVESDPLPINGTHVNLAIRFKDKPYMTPSQVCAVYNYLWYHLPTLIAATANTPYCCGGRNLAASCRLLKSRVLKPNRHARLERPPKRPTLTQTQYYGRLRYKLRLRKDTEFEERVVAHPNGKRLVDITPRGPASNVTGDENESPERNRVEVRAIDNQKSLDYLHDVILLIAGLGVHGFYLYEKEGRMSYPDEHHMENRERAIRSGIEAEFVREDGIVEAREALLELIGLVEEIVDEFGLSFRSQLRNGKTELEERPSLKVERKFEELARYEGKEVVVRLGSDRVLEIDGKRVRIPEGTRLVGRLTPVADYEYRRDRLGFVKDIVRARITVGVDQPVVVAEREGVLGRLPRGVRVPLKEGDQIVQLEHVSRGIVSRW
ncbi:MAG: hypothetical protein ACXQTC_04635 [Methanopyraceae archaeon]